MMKPITLSISHLLILSQEINWLAIIYKPQLSGFNFTLTGECTGFATEIWFFFEDTKCCSISIVTAYIIFSVDANQFYDFSPKKLLLNKLINFD